MGKCDGLSFFVKLEKFCCAEISIMLLHQKIKGGKEHERNIKKNGICNFNYGHGNYQCQPGWFTGKCSNQETNENYVECQKKNINSREELSIEGKKCKA